MSTPYLGDFKAGATVRRGFSFHTAAGGAANPSTGGTIRVYKNSSTTERSSSNGITYTINWDTVTGQAHVSVDTSDNSDAGFYAAGNDYLVMLVGAVIDGETVNEALFTFSIENRNDSADIKKVDGGTQEASRLKNNLTGMTPFTVDSGNFTPTTTEFETNLSEATADHYKGCRVIWLTGALAGGNPKDINAYSLVSAKGHITVTSAMTEAPANGDTGIIIP